MKSMEKVMQKWKSYGKHFQQNRLYMGILLLTAVCAYGYKVTNATIGIDDTPSLYYFEEGLIAIVGRWVLFLLNKVVSLAEFVPFVTDFAAVVILVLAAVVWSVLFYSMLWHQPVLCQGMAEQYPENAKRIRYPAETGMPGSG